MKYFLLITITAILTTCSTLFETENSSRIFRFRLINEKGIQIGEDTFEDVKAYSAGFIAVKQNGLWGFADKNGILKIPFQFKDVSNFSEDPPWAAAEFTTNEDPTNKNWGYIDTSGNIVVKPQFYFASEFKNGVAQVATERLKYKLHHRYEKYFFTKEGKFIYLDGEYGVYSDISTHHLSEGMLPSCQKGLWGFKNVKDEWIIPPTYDEVGSFSDGLAKAKKGSLVTEKDCIYIDPKDNSGYWGYIDTLGKEKIPFKFKRAGIFHHGIALVNENYSSTLTPAGSYSFYFIDKTGKNKFNLFFSTASDFSVDGFAKVGLDKDRILDSNRKTKRLFGNGSIIDHQGNPIDLSLEEGVDIFNIYPSETGGIMRITFIQLSDPRNEYSEKSYYTMYFNKNLTSYLNKKFPPTFRKFAGPVDEMSGDFQSGLTWEAFEVKPNR